jgi:hypothetical protein
MTGGAAMRGLVSPGRDFVDIAADNEWPNFSAPAVLPDWPSGSNLTVLATWRVGIAQLSEVEDQFIARRYVVSAGAAGKDLLYGLIRRGELVSPEVLLQAARAAGGWAAQNDTLYDLVAGCADPAAAEVHEVWSQRLASDHPLTRLVACWVGPYLSGSDVRDAIESVARQDEEQRIRAAARSSASVIARRNSADAPRP